MNSDIEIILEAVADDFSHIGLRESDNEIDGDFLENEDNLLSYEDDEQRYLANNATEKVFERRKQGSPLQCRFYYTDKAWRITSCLKKRLDSEDSVANYMDKIIESAMSEEILSQIYEGWMAWI